MLMKQFKRELKNETDSIIIPKELIELFNQNLPNGLNYISQGNGILMVDHKLMKSTCYLQEKENESWLKKYRKYFKTELDPIEIMVLTQTPLAIKISDTIECDGIKIPSELLIQSITDKNYEQKLISYLVPLELPSLSIVFSILGKDIELNTILKLQKCEDIENLTYNNFSEESAFRVSITMPSKYNPDKTIKCGQINIGVDKTKADSLEEAINAYELYSAFLSKQLLINRLNLYPENVSEERMNDKIKEISINLKLLKALRLLEKKLNTHFNLSKGIDNETLDIILKLYVSIIEDKAAKEREKLETISFENNFEDINETNNLKNSPSAFITSGTLTINVLGETLNLFYATCYFSIVLKNIEKLTEDGDYKLIFDCTASNFFASTKIYLDQDTMITESQKNFVNYFGSPVVLESIEKVLNDL